jgi:hypothetical protein
MIMSGKGFQLKKSVWTHHDFETMCWHDSTIYGVSFHSWELAFDIDYIFKWEDQGQDAGYRFWVSPATLVFQDVNGWKGTAEIWTGFPLTPVIMEIKRSTKRNNNLAGEPWHWIIELEHGHLEFHAGGFTQFTRAKPIFQHGQTVLRETCGDVSFNRPENI